MIKDLTLKPLCSPSVVSINKDWNPPSLLHVDRATRQAFQNDYFTTNTFGFSSLLSTNAGLEMCAHWQRSLGLYSNSQIGHLRFACSYFAPNPPLDCSVLWEYLRHVDDEVVARITIREVDASLYGALDVHNFRQALALTELLTIERFEHAGENEWISDADVNAEMKLQWHGPDGTVRNLWVLRGGCNTERAERALIEGVQRECRASGRKEGK